jgi:hypothetical protein
MGVLYKHGRVYFNSIGKGKEGRRRGKWGLGTPNMYEFRGLKMSDQLIRLIPWLPVHHMYVCMYRGVNMV